MIISRSANRPPKIKNPSGETVQEFLGQVVGNVTSHSLAEVTIPPGKCSIPHYHKVSEESYWIIKGMATLTIDGKTFELQPGDACLIQANEVHQIMNNENSELKFLAVCVPAWHAKDSYETKDKGC